MTVEEGIEVNVPVNTAYNQWTQFEEFPQFMGGVESVTQLDDQRLHWVAEIGGVKREWHSTITEQVPDKRIAWKGEGEVHNSGVVTFHYIDDNKCRVMLQMELEPGNLVEKIGDVLGFVDRQAKADMKRFKEFIESRGTETGAWRGEIEQGKVQK